MFALNLYIRNGTLALAVLVLAVPAASAQTALGGAFGCSVVEVLSNSVTLGIHDRAGLFGFEAAVKAREAIREYRRDYHRDLFIETVAHVPVQDQRGVKSAGRRAREQYFANWAKRRAQVIGVDGVYILICKDPRHVHVLVHPATPEQTFSTANAQDLRKRLEHQLVKVPDTALFDAVHFVRESVKENLADRAAASSSIRFETVAAIVGGIICFWLLLSLARAVLHHFGSNAGGDLPRVGLLAGFFAALFGTSAGHWIYDHVFHAHAQSIRRQESDPDLDEISSVGAREARGKT